MKLQCHVSGIEFNLESFPILSSSPKQYLHPTIQYYKDFLLSNKTVLLNNFSELSPTEKRLVYSATLYYSDVVLFNHPINATDEVINTSFHTIYPTLAWARQVSPIRKSTLPSFRIDKDTSNLETFTNGFIPELINCRNDFRQRDRDLALQEVITRLDNIAKKRVINGLPPLNNQILDFLFQSFNIPLTDYPIYKDYLQKDTLNLALNSDKPLVHLLDLEEYAEAWFSTSLIKLYFLRYVRGRIEQLVELGVQLPKSYYILDEDTGEYKPVHKTATATKLQKSGSFSFTEISIPVKNNPNRPPKPIRDNFPDVLSYVKALKDWSLTS